MINILSAFGYIGYSNIHISLNLFWFFDNRKRTRRSKRVTVSTRKTNTMNNANVFIVVTVDYYFRSISYIVQNSLFLNVIFLRLGYGIALQWNKYEKNRMRTIRIVNPVPIFIRNNLYSTKLV